MNLRHLFHPCGIMMLLLTLTLGSCGMMDYEGPDCTTYRRIRFTYDWNMLYADAFPHEVKTLTLYAFNPDSTIAWTKNVSTDSIIAKGYMDINDVPAGTYDLQVWAEGQQYYPNTYTFGQGSRQRDLTATVNGNASIDHEMTPLYYGRLHNADLTDLPTGGTREVTVNLKKDTELFRIVLQQQNGDTINPADFKFIITDDNTYLDADNDVVARSISDSITYNAWSQYSGMAGVVDPESASTADDPSVTTTLSAVVAELTTNRLVTSHHPRLHVYSLVDEGREIINIPLVDACLLVKGYYNRSMTDQEYLDRQDTWDFVFFLDHNRQWLAASIMVQQWRVVWQEHNIGS